MGPFNLWPTVGSNFLFQQLYIIFDEPAEKVVVHFSGIHFGFCSARVIRSTVMTLDISCIQLMTTFAVWSEEVLPLQSCLIFSGEACYHKSKATHPSWVESIPESARVRISRLSKSIDSFVLDLCWQKFEGGRCPDCCKFWYHLDGFGY